MILTLAQLNYWAGSPYVKGFNLACLAALLGLEPLRSDEKLREEILEHLLDAMLKHGVASEVNLPKNAEEFFKRLFDMQDGKIKEEKDFLLVFSSNKTALLSQHEMCPALEVAKSESAKLLRL